MKLIWVLVSLAGLLLLLTRGMQPGLLSVKAFEPKMDYWFTETLAVDKVELPVGVVIYTSDPATQPRAVMTLENQTGTILFVLSLNYKNVLVMQTPDPNWKARVSIAHEVASYLVAPNKPRSLNVDGLSDLDRNLVDRNVLSFDPPPPDLSIPAAQSSELLLVYNTQVIEVPFTLTYALNINFNNGSQTNLQETANLQATGNSGVTVTQQAEASTALVIRNNIRVIGLAGVAVLLIAGWLVWRGLAHRK